MSEMIKNNYFTDPTHTLHIPDGKILVRKREQQLDCLDREKNTINNPETEQCQKHFLCIIKSEKKIGQ